MATLGEVALGGTTPKKVALEAGAMLRGVASGEAMLEVYLEPIRVPSWQH